MRTNIRKNLCLLALAAAAFTISTGGIGRTAPRPTRADGQKRISFQIDMVEEDGGTRNPLSSAIVEGPPGLDFNITLHAGRYDMNAKFLTDPTSKGTLEVRARLDTHRLYGSSENKLPLYEEDTRSQTLELAFDEQMILFPFGENGGDNLQIEIAPAITSHDVYQPSGRFVPPQITFSKKIQGVIHIEATKAPHRFQVEAALVEDGREIARGAGEFVLQQKRELSLSPIDRAAGVEPAAGITLSIDRYIQGCPIGSAAFTFDVTAPDGAAQTGRQTIASDWAGIRELDSDAIYDLSGTSLGAAGKKRQLKLRIMPANGETGY